MLVSFYNIHKQVHFQGRISQVCIYLYSNVFKIVYSGKPCNIAKDKYRTEPVFAISLSKPASFELIVISKAYDIPPEMNQF